MHTWWSVCLALVLFLVFPRSVQAQSEGWHTHLALGVYMTTSFADVAQTGYCLGARTCHEANPLFRTVMNRHGVVSSLVLKGAFNTGIAALLLHDHRAHPKRTFWLAVAAAGIQTTVVIHNAKTLRP